MACNTAATGWNIAKALIARFLFIIQVFLMVWRVVSTNGRTYWCLILLLIPLIGETIYTVVKRKGLEFKWVSVSFLAFLIAAVPPFWLLELHRIHSFNKVVRAKSDDKGDEGDEKEGLAGLFGFTIPLYLERDMWVKVLQQTFILLLVPVRWIVPRGPITRDRLSQILLVYVATGTDITELLDLYDIPGVMKDKRVSIAILVLWTVSLLQFIFLLTSSGSQNEKVVPFEPSEGINEASARRESGTSITSGTDWKEKVDRVEVGALVMSLLIQDVPFLCIRMYIMVSFRNFSNSLLVFVSKNVYMILLQIYRMYSVTCCAEEEDDDHEEYVIGEKQNNTDVEKGQATEIKDDEVNVIGEKQDNTDVEKGQTTEIKDNEDYVRPTGEKQNNTDVENGQATDIKDKEDSGGDQAPVRSPRETNGHI